MTKGLCNDGGVMQRTTHFRFTSQPRTLRRRTPGNYMSSWLERNRRELERERIEAEDKARQRLANTAD